MWTKTHPATILANSLLWLQLAWIILDPSSHVEFVIFCSLYFRNNPTVLGENNGNLPRILGIIAEVFKREALQNSPEVSKRLVNIVKQIQVSLHYYVKLLLSNVWKIV